MTVRSESAPADFRVFLQEQLEERCRVNSQYSLRSFARSLGIGSSDLSKLIRLRRQLSDASLVKLANKLRLDPEVTELYRASLRKSQNTKQKRAGAIKAPENFREVSLDAFRIVGDWYHFAILELMKVRGFRSESRWIARRLGLTTSEVNIAIQRLQQCGFLEIKPDGTWVDHAGSTSSISATYADVAARRQQRQILEKAIYAVENIPMPHASQSSMLMAINKANLPAAREMIKDFRRKLCALLEEGTYKDDIYYLTVGLFPILKPMESGEVNETN
jgi:uncharacterized protein (TIGR02147 family)